MSKFVDGLALSFKHFVSLADPKWRCSSSMSFINPQIDHTVQLTGRVTSEVPEKMHSQSFDEDYLLPIAQKLGLDIAKTAILIALRNAWIAYFQETEISKISVDEIRLLMTNEIATEYVVLTSSKWTEHPWIREQIDQFQIEVYPVCTAPLDRPIDAMYHEAWIDEQQNDINFLINEFRSQKGAYTLDNVFLEVDAEFAEYDIQRAKKEIRGLHSEVEKQEAIIRQAMKPIRKLQNYERALKKRTPGRPKISEAQQQRQDLAMKFVEKWISSLMAVVLVSSCGELAKIIGGQKMTWWRWQNGKTLPRSSVFEPLLDVKIKSGEHKDTKLRDIQTTPLLIDLITLIDLV
jgi:hypothetical protein